ncbi:MAG: hydrolase [Sulfurimonadaceae bacterium]|nr:hydrolase [Sulfurimonadaceae bacterium]
MRTNALPPYDISDNPTGCCPRFNPDGWDGQELHFDAKPFVKATTYSLFHIPLNMGSVFEKTFNAIETADAYTPDNLIILSEEVSPWKAYHFFSVNKDVPGETMTTLSGDYITKVFEGPYKDAPKWMDEMNTIAEEKGKKVLKTYMFYTTCPKCAKVYGKNYVVAVTQIA